MSKLIYTYRVIQRVNNPRAGVRQFKLLEREPNVDVLSY